VMRVVCARFSITRRALLSQRRTLEVVRPRQIAMYLAKVVTLRSFPEIGRRFGGRDHTTVIHAVDKIANMMLTDRELAEEISILRGMLEGE
jgi:chromosomal replication initiator protein